MENDTRPRCYHGVVFPEIDCISCIAEQRDALKAENERLSVAIKAIADMGGQTLLGKCCVEGTCRPYEEYRCELQYKVASAFDQAASAAKTALTPTQGGENKDG